MRLSLDALQVLDAIDRNGGFGTAARELHRVPSAITYSVQKLESDLDVQLFSRVGKQAQLTEAGRMLLDSGRDLLAQALELETRVKRTADGWETSLHIAHDEVLPMGPLFALLSDFYAEGSPTPLRLNAEVLGGCWDALLMRRADLVMGAPGDPPSVGGIATRQIGQLDFVFAVAPHHPLASAREPISTVRLQAFRAVAVADSSQHLPVRSSGLLPGQSVLTVSSLRAKLEAQMAGLGVGFLPVHLAQPAIEARLLIVKEVEASKPSMLLHLGWRTRQPGRALTWFLERLANAPSLARLLAETQPGTAARSTTKRAHPRQSV